MSIPALRVEKTLSKWQIARLQKLGASINSATNAITATESQMWLARINSGLRRLLELRGNVAKSTHFP